MFRQVEENDGFLVSAKLQQVALRTPPATDSFLIQCFGTGQPGKPVRLPREATFLDLLLRLGLITVDEHRSGTESVARSLGGTRQQRFDIRPALGDGSPNTAFPATNLLERAELRVLDSPGLRFPYSIFIAATDEFREAVGPALPRFASALDIAESPEDDSGPVNSRPDHLGASHSMTMPNNAVEEPELFATPLDVTRSRSEQRRERRAQYEAERQRVREIETKRVTSLKAIEERQMADEASARAAAVKEEARRQARALAHLTALGERRAKAESRAVVASEEKKAIERRRVTCMLSAKVELEQQIELARQELQESATAAVTPSTTSQEEALLSKGGVLRLVSTANYNLPMGEETADIILEKRQAAESFVNRVVAAKKLNERRLSRFSTNAQHPLAQSRCLSDILDSLRSIVSSDQSETSSHLTDAQTNHVEATKASYHTQLMKQATEARVQLKMQRHREKLQAQVREARLAEEKKQEAADKLKALQAEEQQFAEKFRERKRKVEADAQRRATEEQEYEIYMNRQRSMLHQH
jgi:hypothetical protein